MTYYIDLSRRYQQLKIEGYRIDIYQAEGDNIEYCNDFEAITRRASLRLAKWARGLHGNAPSGTVYGSYRITLPDHRRVSVKAYL